MNKNNFFTKIGLLSILIFGSVGVISGCQKDNGTYEFEYFIDNVTRAYVSESIKTTEFDGLLLPEKRGHSFSGWYLDPQLTKPFIKEEHLTSRKKMYLYGKFIENPNYITICYHLNGGSRSDYNYSKIYFDVGYGVDHMGNAVVSNFSQTFNPAAPTKDGYVFDGWFIDEDLSIPFDNFLCFKELQSNPVICLYAKWI